MKTACLATDILTCTSGDSSKSSSALKFISDFEPAIQDISAALYEHLFVEDRREFIKWLLYRYAKIDVLEDGEMESYQALVNRMKSLSRTKTMTVNGRNVPVVDLAEIGYGAKFLYTSYLVLANDFALNQYYHDCVHPLKGDVLIDAGAYTGDTALMFALNTGFACHTHSFEISEANIRAFHANCSLNPRLAATCTMNKYAISDISGCKVYFTEGDYKDNVFSAFSVSDDKKGVCVQTMTIDEYVNKNNLASVDFIKMDIEGAEEAALKGALSTICRFKPRMALSLYHKRTDLTAIPKMVRNANSNYCFGFKWCNKILKNEAVLFVIDKSLVTD